jgi:manganese efflux pump family protein
MVRTEAVLSLGEMLLLALALGMDAFSVALGVGLTVAGKRPVFRLSWHFGLFQFLMPLLGWQAARLVSARVGSLGAWVGAGLLLVIGGRMLRDGWRKRKGGREQVPADPTRGWSLVGLSVATSIDALGVGFGVGLAAQGDLMKACVVIGLVAGALTFLGMQFGRALGRRFGAAAEILGGAVLLLLGVRMLWG